MSLLAELFYKYKWLVEINGGSVWKARALQIHTGEPVWLGVRRWAGKQKDICSIPIRLSFLSRKVVVYRLCLVTLSLGAKWLEHGNRDWRVAGSDPGRRGGRIFFSRVDLLCWLLFRYPFNPRVTAVARKRSRSFCPKVSDKHAYTLRMWLCMKWHGAWLYGVHRICAETAAVSCGTSHVSA